MTAEWGGHICFSEHTFAKELKRDRPTGPSVLGGKGSAESQRTLRSPPITYYSLTVSEATGRSSNSPF